MEARGRKGIRYASQNPWIFRASLAPVRNRPAPVAAPPRTCCHLRSLYFIYFIYFIYFLYLFHFPVTFPPSPCIPS